ncbi:MAG: thioesterase [Desulfuromonas sp.]|nr:MAG: thioesterase [Desulfuromonas sp.]
MNHTINKGQNISKHCFICGTANPFGLKTRFYETADKEVIALFTARAEHQSYPGIAHGGITAAILDETIGRAIMVFYDQMTFGVTVDLQIRYKQPIPLDVELKAIGRITADKGRIFEGTGELYLPDGRIAATAEGKYLKRNLDQITERDFVNEEWFAPAGDLPDAIELP